MLKHKANEIDTEKIVLNEKLFLLSKIPLGDIN
jgi:hypothetical protein